MSLDAAPLDFDEALAYIKRALTFGIHPSLESMFEIARALKNPESRFSSLQIAGTNGKSSTAFMTSLILAAEGFETGRYISPHLLDITERISHSSKDKHLIKDISRDEFALAFNQVLQAIHDINLTRPESQDPFALTEFELLGATALKHFENRHADFAVLEVGLGGRWDATSIVNPAVAAITGISLDHTDKLGKTKEEIAHDKSHIIKAGSTPVLGEGFDDVLDIFLKRAEDLDGHPRVVRRGDEPSPVVEERTIRFYIHESSYASKEELEAGTFNQLVSTRFSVKTPHADYQDLKLNTAPYQVKNAALAIAIAESALGRALKYERLIKALAVFYIPARLELISKDPLVIYDGAHNPEAATILAKELEALGLKPTIAIGAFKDKDLEKVIEILAPHASSFIAIGTNDPRHLGRLRSAAEVSKLISQVTKGEVLATLEEANLESLLEVNASKPLLITGSLSLYHLIK